MDFDDYVKIGDFGLAIDYLVFVVSIFKINLCLEMDSYVLIVLKVLECGIMSLLNFVVLFLGNYVGLKGWVENDFLSCEIVNMFERVYFIWKILNYWFVDDIYVKGIWYFMK